VKPVTLLSGKWQVVSGKLRGASADCINLLLGAKPIIPVCQRQIGRGQGTRPPPVADKGSVSWRSGQNSVKRIANKEFWAPQEDT